MRDVEVPLASYGGSSQRRACFAEGELCGLLADDGARFFEAASKVRASSN